MASVRSFECEMQRNPAGEGNADVVVDSHHARTAHGRPAGRLGGEMTERVEVGASVDIRSVREVMCVREDAPSGQHELSDGGHRCVGDDGVLCHGHVPVAQGAVCRQQSHMANAPSIDFPHGRRTRPKEMPKIAAVLSLITGYSDAHVAIVRSNRNTARKLPAPHSGTQQDSSQPRRLRALDAGLHSARCGVVCCWHAKKNPVPVSCMCASSFSVFLIMPAKMAVLGRWKSGDAIFSPSTPMTSRVSEPRIRRALRWSSHAVYFSPM